MNDPLQRRAMLGFIAITAGALACRRAFGGDAHADRTCDTPGPTPASQYASDPPDASSARTEITTREHPLSASAAARRRLLAACRAASR